MMTNFNKLTIQLNNGNTEIFKNGIFSYDTTNRCIIVGGVAGESSHTYIMFPIINVLYCKVEEKHESL